MEDKEIKGSCAAGFEWLCIGWKQSQECCCNYDCEHFIGLNDFSQELHEKAFED